MEGNHCSLLTVQHHTPSSFHNLPPHLCRLGLQGAQCWHKLDTLGWPSHWSAGARPLGTLGCLPPIHRPLPLSHGFSWSRISAIQRESGSVEATHTCTAPKATPRTHMHTLPLSHVNSAHIHMHKHTFSAATQRQPFFVIWCHVWDTFSGGSQHVVSIDVCTASPVFRITVATF